MRDKAKRLSWERVTDIHTLGHAVAAASGFDTVSIAPLPETATPLGVTGLTVADGRDVMVYYDDTLPLLNQNQIVCHEYAHILHGDVGRGDYEQVHRTVFDDPAEHRAELTGMWLSVELRRHTGDSDVTRFLSGMGA